jgi:dTMP kinase
MVALSTGLIGGGMLVPLGPDFSAAVLGAGDPGFGLLITALGVGVAVGVISLSIFQRRIPKETVFIGSVFGAGSSLLIAASLSDIRPVFLLIVVLGVCAGSVYVLGFTILQESVDDELRGRIFSTLYTLVRLCLLLSFALAGFLADLLDKVSRDLVDRTITVGDAVFFLPGVRLTLLLSGLIILGAGVLAVLSVRVGGRPHAAAAAEAE